MAYTSSSKKLKRSALIHYIDCSTTVGTTSWFLIGKDVEDMSVELSSDVSTFTNILDETSVTDNGYTASTDVDTYYADPADTRACSHKRKRTSFRQILPITALIFLAIRQYACGKLPCSQQNYAQKSAHYA